MLNVNKIKFKKLKIKKNLLSIVQGTAQRQRNFGVFGEKLLYGQ
jgi:hypothetical protein